MTAPEQPVSIRPWRFAIFAMFAGNGLAIGTWASRTPATAHELGLGLAQMGLLITTIPLGALLGLLVSSHVLERLGERRTAVAAQFVGMVSFALFGVNAVLTGNPICARLTERASATAGVRDAHVPIASPLLANNAKTAARHGARRTCSRGVGACAVTS